MKPNRLSLAATLVTAVLVFSIALSLAHAQGDESAVEKVEKLFAPWNRTDMPGCAVGVARDGQPVLERAFGMADLEHGIANAPDTVFEAGSVSKQFTAAAVLLLAQQGKLSLDDPVRKHVPELPDYGSSLTIRHMLHHTSGLRDWGTVVAVGGWPRGSRVYTHAHVLDVVSRQRALNFPPGSEYSYSNSGYNLAAIVVSRASGMTFADFTREVFFEPLGMTSTQWRDDYARIVRRRAVAYAVEEGRLRLQMPFENVHGNGGLLTTVGDLLAWNENFVHGRVGGPALAEAQLAPGRLNDGRVIHYASGLFVRRWRGVREVSHDGATAGYRAFLGRYPDPRLSVAVLCNADNANAPKLGRGVAEVYLDGSLEAPGPDSGITLAAAELEGRAGLYKNLRELDAMRLIVEDGRLRVDGGASLVPLTGSTFRMDSGSARLDFDLDGTGRARGLLMHLEDGDALPFEPVAQARPTARELEEIAGTYVSDEAEASFEVAAVPDGLVLRQRPDTTITLTPTYRDSFAARGGHVRFIRDAQGRVVEMSLRRPRLRDLRFKRMASPGVLREKAPGPAGDR